MYRIQSGAAIGQRGDETAVGHAATRFEVGAIAIGRWQMLEAEANSFGSEELGQMISATVAGIRAVATIEEVRVTREVGLDGVRERIETGVCCDPGRAGQR